MRVTELQNVTIGIIPLKNHPSNKAYRMTVQDHDVNEVFWVDLSKEVADAIVSNLSGGIVVARDFPKPVGLDGFSRKV